MINVKPMNSSDLFLTVPLPSGIDPAVASSLQFGVEQAIQVLGDDINSKVLPSADDMARLISGLTHPNVGLIEELALQQKTMKAVFHDDQWLTADMINRLQTSPPANASHPASDWKRRGRVYSVTYDGKEYFARYQFDALCQPLPIIKEVLNAIGEVADSWKLAAWFHYPNGWIADAKDGSRPVAPKDALDRRDDVLAAARRMKGSYEA
ncbi:hypothetical protein B0G84_8765 [Paraburkholderia sp. BL8N3]|nr:hypothetical protein [Paraburkholderia sp. BL8N3]TCK32859.1 hypothetical protein B0G84_8765 [Paraburkholderia sp. BL8N3]